MITIESMLESSIPETKHPEPQSIDDILKIFHENGSIGESMKKVGQCEPNIGKMRNRWETLQFLMGFIIRLKQNEGYDVDRMLGMTTEEASTFRAAASILHTKISNYQYTAKSSITKDLYDQIVASC